jgi:hypothetical protein
MSDKVKLPFICFFRLQKKTALYYQTNFEFFNRQLTSSVLIIF